MMLLALTFAAALIVPLGLDLYMPVPEENPTDKTGSRRAVSR